MTVLRDKEVRFDEYCKKCKHWNLPESEDPCDLCLENPSNEWSRKPVYFEEEERRASRVDRKKASNLYSSKAKQLSKGKRPYTWDKEASKVIK